VRFSQYHFTLNHTILFCTHHTIAFHFVVTAKYRFWNDVTQIVLYSIRQRHQLQEMKCPSVQRLESIPYTSFPFYQYASSVGDSCDSNGKNNNYNTIRRQLILGTNNSELAVICWWKIPKLLLRYARKYETVSVWLLRVIGSYLLDLGVFQTPVGWLKHGV